MLSRSRCDEDVSHIQGDNRSFGHAPWWEGKCGTVRAVQLFPTRGCDRNFRYRFEYNLHLIKILSHLNRESIYNVFVHTICHSTCCSANHGTFSHNFVERDSQYKFNVSWLSKCIYGEPKIFCEPCSYYDPFSVPQWPLRSNLRGSHFQKISRRSMPPRPP